MSGNDLYCKACQSHHHPIDECDQRDPACCDCKFWVEDGLREGALVGECHRYPPVAESNQKIVDAIMAKTNGYGFETTRFIHPQTVGFNFCGEFAHAQNNKKAL